MKGRILHVTQEEIAELIDVNGAPPELRKQAQATLDFLLHHIFVEPIDPRPMREAEARGDIAAATEEAGRYYFALGKQARAFGLDAIHGRKALDKLAAARAEKDRKAAEYSQHVRDAAAPFWRPGRQLKKVAEETRKALLREYEETGEPKPPPGIKRITAIISGSE